MKAIRYHEWGGPDVLQIEEIPVPEISADEVLLRVHVAGVNFADTMLRRNVHPGGPCQMPMIPGFEAAGIVESVGINVKNFRPGDRVLTFKPSGCYSEYVGSHESSTFLLPLTISFEQAVTLPGQGLTAYFMLKEALARFSAYNSSRSVLIHAAAGGVGIQALQLASIFGAQNVIGTVGSDDKLELLRELDLGVGVNYEKEGWGSEAIDLNNGEKFDLILDSVGGDILSSSFELLASGGEIIVYGKAADVPFAFDPVMLIAANQSLRGFSLKPYLSDRQAMEAALTILFDYVAQDLLKLYVSGRFPLEEASLAHKLMENRKTSGKLVLAL